MKRTVINMLAVMMMISAAPAFGDSAGWQTNFEQARKTADEKKQPIMALFTGSDWCPWCKKLDKEVLSQAEFKNYAKDNLVLFIADFPSSKKLPEATATQNKALSEKYKVEGFPTVLILSADGKVIGKTSYMPGGPAKYVENLKTLISAKTEVEK